MRTMVHASQGAPLEARTGHRRVWRLALPIIVSNATVPLLGAVDTAVVGHLPGAHYLGGVAIGAMIFNFLYWASNFLRFGTSGFAAQAYGARDGDETRASLARALLLAAGIGLLIMLLASPILWVALTLLEASAEVEAQAALYFQIRVLAAPAALAHFALNGWLIGMHRMRAVLGVQLATNGGNIALTMLFVLGFGWEVPGVALGTVLAEYLGAAYALHLCRPALASLPGRLSWASVLNPDRLARTFQVNFDIFLRTLSLVIAFSLFTAEGAKAGDAVLAANAVLMQLLHIASYALDGFAAAAEALVGAAFGQRHREGVRLAVRLAVLWGGVAALGFSALLALGGFFAVQLFTGVPEVRAAALAYLPWAIVLPPLGVWCYLLDGVFAGATRSADMRNTMALALAVYLVVLYGLAASLGNHGLWLALATFLAVRGLGLWSRYPALLRSVGQPTS